MYDHFHYVLVESFNHVLAPHFLVSFFSFNFHQIEKNFSRIIVAYFSNFIAQMIRFGLIFEQLEYQVHLYLAHFESLKNSPQSF
jgi:hypothetical protein